MMVRKKEMNLCRCERTVFNVDFIGVMISVNRENVRDQTAYSIQWIQKAHRLVEEWQLCNDHVKSNQCTDFQHVTSVSTFSSEMAFPQNKIN